MSFQEETIVYVVQEEQYDHPVSPEIFLSEAKAKERLIELVNKNVDMDYSTFEDAVRGAEALGSRWDIHFYETKLR